MADTASALLAKVNDADGWTQTAESDGVIIFEKENDTGHSIFKGVCVAPHSVSTLAATLWDLEKRSGWDELFTNVTATEKTSDNARKTELTLKLKVPLVSDRDLVLVEELKKSDDEAVLSFVSAPEDASPPPQGGLVRAVAYPSGIVIQAKPDREPALCTLTYLIHLDLSGSLPAVAVRRYITGIISALGTIAASVESAPAEAPEEPKGASGTFAGFFAAATAVASTAASTVGGVASSAASTVGGVASSAASTVGGVASSAASTVGGAVNSISGTSGEEGEKPTDADAAATAEAKPAETAAGPEESAVSRGGIFDSVFATASGFASTAAATASTAAATAAATATAAAATATSAASSAATSAAGAAGSVSETAGGTASGFFGRVTGLFGTSAAPAEPAAEAPKASEEPAK